MARPVMRKKRARRKCQFKCLTASQIAAQQQQSPGDPINVVLLAGQSNAHTLFDGVRLTPSLQPFIEDFAFYEQWRDETYIIDWIASGTPVEWPLLAAKINLILGSTVRPIVWRVVWVQGEADSTIDPPNSAVYAAALRTVFSQLRSPVLCGADALIYIVALNPNMLPFLPVIPGAAGITSIRDAEALVATDPGNLYIETSDIAMTGIHYGALGSTNYLTLGARIGDAIAAGL